MEKISIEFIKKRAVQGDHLFLTGQGLREGTLPTIFEYIEKFCRDLANIHLGWSQFTDEGAKRIGTWLQQNSTIIKLELEVSGLSDVGARHIAASLHHNTTLTWLDLYGNHIADVGAGHIAEALKVNTTLTWLNMRCNHIADVGAGHIADALKVNTTLTVLNMGWNRITYTGVERIIKSMEHNSTLTEFDMGDDYVARYFKDETLDVAQRNRRNRDQREMTLLELLWDPVVNKKNGAARIERAPSSPGLRRTRPLY